VAAAHGITLVTRNPEDVSGLAGIVTVVEVWGANSPEHLVAQRTPVPPVTHTVTP